MELGLQPCILTEDTFAGNSFLNPIMVMQANELAVDIHITITVSMDIFGPPLFSPSLLQVFLIHHAVCRAIHVILLC